MRRTQSDMEIEGEVDCGFVDLDFVAQRSRLPLALDASDNPPPAKRFDKLGRDSHFSSREELCYEMTKIRKNRAGLERGRPFARQDGDRN